MIINLTPIARTLRNQNVKVVVKAGMCLIFVAGILVASFTLKEAMLVETVIEGAKFF